MLLEPKNRAEAWKLYLLAAQNHIIEAYEKVAEGYKQKNDIEGMKMAYMEGGKAGDASSYIKLGEFYLLNGNEEEAFSCFKKAGLRGLEKCIEHARSAEEREKGKGRPQ